MEVSEKEMFQAMLDKAEKTAEEKEKKQNEEGCPDCFCEDCDIDCPARELGLIK
jgi:hypothetical protein